MSDTRHSHLFARSDLLFMDGSIEETKPSLQLLVDNGIISLEERKEIRTRLLPENVEDTLTSEEGNVWATQTLIGIIEKIRPLARCTLGDQWQSQLLCKRSYTTLEFDQVAQLLNDRFHAAVQRALTSQITADPITRQVTHWPDGLCQLFQSKSGSTLRGKLFQQLRSFFSQRPQLLQDPAIASAAKILIESQWERIVKAVRPYSKLWLELQAGEELLKKIDPEAVPEPEEVHCDDNEVILLEKADLDVLVEASDMLRVLLKGRNFSQDNAPVVSISSEQFQALLNCLCKGQEPTLETLPSLLIVADMYLIDTLAPTCLQWVKKFADTKKDTENSRQTLESICWMQQELSDKLPILEREWGEVRDHVVSAHLSRAPQAALLSQWVATLVDSQPERISWPSKLSLASRYDFSHFTPLTAIKELTLRSPFKIAHLGKLQALRQLESLEFKEEGMGEDADWDSLLELPSLHTLKFMSRCDQFDILCKTLEKLRTLHTLTLPSAKFLNIAAMPPLHTLEILAICPLAFCTNAFRSSRTLETLIVPHAQVSAPMHSFGIHVQRSTGVLEAQLNAPALSEYQAAYPNIPQHICDQLFAAFDFVQQINFTYRDYQLLLSDEVKTVYKGQQTIQKGRDAE